MTRSQILLAWLLMFAAAGCGEGPTPRLLDLVGKEAVEGKEPPTTNTEWTRVSRIGLAVHSDSTGRKAAPAISSEYLETLTRRTEEFLKRRCSIREFVPVPPFIDPSNLSQDLQTQGQLSNVQYHMVIVLSSREQAGPEKIGEATMMTQMGGTVIENSAVAEVGVFRVSDFKMVFFATGQGSETLEQLDVPIGKDRPSTADARDILRAQAGQQALDRALERAGSACQIQR